MGASVPKSPYPVFSSLAKERGMGICSEDSRIRFVTVACRTEKQG